MPRGDADEIWPIPDPSFFISTCAVLSGARWLTCDDPGKLILSAKNRLA